MSPDNVQVVEVVTGIKKLRKNLTQERIKELFDFNEETGILTRKPSLRDKKGGKVVGCLANHGYLVVRIDYTLYLLHRIIWLYAYGYLPEHQIDHINRNKCDNRLENLREATRSCNVRNTGLRSDNTSGIKGVYWHTQLKKWNPKIFSKRKVVSLGLFYDFTEAVAHRLAAEQCLGFHSCNGNSSAKEYLDKYIGGGNI